MGGSSGARGGDRTPYPVQKSSESLQLIQRENYNDDLLGRYPPAGRVHPDSIDWIITRDWLVDFDPISSQLF